MRMGAKINDEIKGQIMEYIGKMEKITGKKFGDKENPLLVSVRSGARASMPGMMDTILNLGLNEEVVNVISAKSGNPRWAWDCYRRFIQMFSDVVMGVGKKYFEKLIDVLKEQKGVTFDVELTADDLHTLADQFKAEYKAQIGKDFPDDPKEQLFEAIEGTLRLRWIKLSLCSRQILRGCLRRWADIRSRSVSLTRRSMNLFPRLKPILKNWPKHRANPLSTLNK